MLKMAFGITLSLLFLINFHSFGFASEKEKKISIGIGGNYFGPKKPHCWGGTSGPIGWEKLDISRKFYDKQWVLSLLLEYKIDPKSSLALNYPIKEYEGNAVITISNIPGYDVWGNPLAFSSSDSQELKIAPISLNYLRYFKKDSSPYLGLGIILQKVRITSEDYISFQDPYNPNEYGSASSRGEFSQNRKGYKFIAGYQFKTNKNILIDIGVKYQDTDKLKGKMKKTWSTGVAEETPIEEIIFFDNTFSGWSYGLKIKYMF